jgi:drug/metabolite transporter (DMT)-like permease
MKDRQKGILIAVFGVVSVTPDAALIIFLSRKGVDPWIIVFWKLLVSGLLSAVYASHVLGGPAESIRTILSTNESIWYHLAVTLPQAAVNIGFTLALIYTATAHALLVINLGPLWCAVLGRFVLHDILPWYTKVALAAAMGCMAIIFVPEIVQHADGADGTSSSSSTSTGYLLSFMTGWMNAVFITASRKGSQLGYNLIAAVPLGSILGALIALTVQQGDVMPVAASWENAQWQFWLAMLAEGAITAIVIMALTIAPTYITGSEVALVLLLEVILGPFWVWLIYDEAPTTWTLVGGFVFVAVLALHEAMPLLLGIDKKEKEHGMNEDDDGADEEMTKLDKEELEKADTKAPCTDHSLTEGT